jgi:thioredoxin-related protein
MHLRILSLLWFLFAATTCFAQDKNDSFTLYKPEANAYAEIHDAVVKASKEHKHVFIQIGGNWCIWCKRLYILMSNDKEIKNYTDSNYIVVHINYSKENKNEQVLQSLGFPQRFGYPVLVVLDEHGNRLHTQNTAYLEEGKGYSAKKILEFLKNWAPAALDPAHYKN